MIELNDVVLEAVSGGTNVVLTSAAPKTGPVIRVAQPISVAEPISIAKLL